MSLLAPPQKGRQERLHEVLEGFRSDRDMEHSSEVQDAPLAHQGWGQPGEKVLKPVNYKTRIPEQPFEKLATHGRSER